MFCILFLLVCLLSTLCPSSGTTIDVTFKRVRRGYGTHEHSHSQSHSPGYGGIQLGAHSGSHRNVLGHSPGYSGIHAHGSGSGSRTHSASIGHGHSPVYPEKKAGHGARSSKNGHGHGHLGNRLHDETYTLENSALVEEGYDVGFTPNLPAYSPAHSPYFVGHSPSGYGESNHARPRPAHQAHHGMTYGGHGQEVRKAHHGVGPSSHGQGHSHGHGRIPQHGHGNYQSGSGGRSLNHLSHGQSHGYGHGHSGALPHRGGGSYPNPHRGYGNSKASLTLINAAALQAIQDVSSLDRAASYSFLGSGLGSYYK